MIDCFFSETSVIYSSVVKFLSTDKSLSTTEDLFVNEAKYLYTYTFFLSIGKSSCDL